MALTWVKIGNLKGPMGPAGEHVRGTLTNAYDLDLVTNPTSNGLWVLSAANSYANKPFPGGGHLIVSISGAGSGEQRAVRYGFPETYVRNLRNFYSTPQTWWPWELQGNSAVDIPEGVNLDDYRTPGKFVIQNTTIANSITGGWPTQVPRGPLFLTVESTAGGIISQLAKNYGATATVLSRATDNVNAPPYPFGSWKDLGDRAPATDPSNAGLANAMRKEDYSFRRGGFKKTGAKPVVALRFDHGLNNFNTVIRPLLEARGLPYALALNSRGWTTPENNTVTAAMVNTWVTGGLCEVWNHGAHHNDASTYAALEDVIITGLSELRAQIPAAQIDGWMVPGVGGTNYMGFNGGQTPEAFYNTSAGRLLLEHHAVSSGAFPNTKQRILDGQIRQGQGHFTMEAQTPTQIIAEIDSAKTAVSGLQLMLHPSLVNTAGYITTAQLTQVLDYIKAELDANRLVVLSPYKMMLADSRA